MANRYFVAGTGGNDKWGQTGAGSNWSLTSGGAGGQAVPLATDDVIFDANSPATCSIETSNKVAKTVTTTGWTGTITFASTIKLSVSGNITLTNTTTLSQGGDAIFEAIAASTITFGGCYVPLFGLRGSVTHALADDGIVGRFYFGSTTSNTVVNGSGKITCTHLDMGLSSTGTLSGTAEIVLGGSSPCDINGPTSTGVLRNNLTFNTSSTVSFFTGTFRYNTGTITYTAGTVDASTVDLVITTANTTLDCGASVVWKTLTVSGTIALTMTSGCYVSGLVSLGGTTLTTTINGQKIYAGGGLTLNGTTAVISGSSDVVMSGTGVLTINTTTPIHNFDLIIDAGAGTITVGASNMRFNFDRIQYLSGKVITTTGAWAIAGPVAKQTIIQSIGTY